MNKIPPTYKIVAKVIHISEPKRQKPDFPLHVTWPCRIYKLGDKMTFNSFELIMDETDAVCLSALDSMMVNLKMWSYGVYPMDKWVENDNDNKRLNTEGNGIIAYHKCTDLDRPVEFEISRVPIDMSKRFPSMSGADKRPGWDKR